MMKMESRLAQYDRYDSCNGCENTQWISEKRTDQ